MYPFCVSVAVCSRLPWHCTFFLRLKRVLSLGPATDARSGGRSPAMAFCPAHEHPLAGKACGITSPDSRMTMSPLVTGHHSTCVSFRPDGRELLVSDGMSIVTGGEREGGERRPQSLFTSEPKRLLPSLRYTVATLHSTTLLKLRCTHSKLIQPTPS